MANVAYFLPMFLTLYHEFLKLRKGQNSSIINIGECCQLESYSRLTLGYFLCFIPGRCLWFIMEPLVARSEDYNYHFFRRTIENIKQAKDVQAPDDDDTNKVSTIWLKYYTPLYQQILFHVIC